jgi:hypothetical protein
MNRPIIQLVEVSKTFGGQKVLEEYEYGNPTKDYGFKRWYPDQGLSAEQIDALEGKWRSTLRDMTKRSSF